MPARSKVDLLPEDVRQAFVEIIASARQVRWHQEGTEPYTIIAKPGSALSWPGAKHPIGKVNHPGLPPRPFMGISADDAKVITALGEVYLDSLAAGRSL